MADDGLVEAITRLLSANGSLTDDELIAMLTAEGVDLGADRDDTLLEAIDETDERVAILVDDRTAWLPSLLAGRVFTHRVEDWEIEHDVLTLAPDLDAVVLLSDDGQARFADGSTAVSAMLPMDEDLLAERGLPVDDLYDSEFLLLPRGSLAQLRHGDLIGLRLSDDRLVLETVDADSADSTALGAALRAIVDELSPIERRMAILTACADDAALFTEPLPPLGTTLASLGFVQHGDWIANDSSDFQGQAEDEQLEELAHRHPLNIEQAEAVLAVMALYDEESDEVDDLASLLSEPVVAYAVRSELSADAERLRAVAERLEPLVAPEARAAVHWLRASAYELSGDLIAAEKALLAAEKLDPTWSPAVLDLAEYANLRGDAVRGLALLRRVGVTSTHPRFGLLNEFLPQPRPGLGRNKPCWCGSGRKYKVCHLNSEQLPLSVRAGWLYQKPEVPADRELLFRLAAERSRYGGSRWEVLRDPLVGDVALFEGGWFAEFVATRGALLPDDERQLAEQWLLVQRSVHDIQQVRPGFGFTVRDLRTGDIHDVTERTASRTLTAGTLICCRVVPAGDTMQIFGGIEPIGLRERDQLIELLDGDPDPIELVALLTARFAPPQLTNTEGDSIAICEATLSVTDPDTLCDILDATYERDDDEVREWIDFVTTDGMRRVRSTLRLDDQLHIQTNSEKRLDRILDELRTLDPSLTVLDESRQPIDDARQAAEAFDLLAPRGPDLDDAEAALVMEQFIRDYEQKWLDDSIPALAGRTPRQAAADPTRRDDLIRLLGSFPDDDSPGTMSPSRLRAALGL